MVGSTRHAGAFAERSAHAMLAPGVIRIRVSGRGAHVSPELVDRQDAGALRADAKLGRLTIGPSRNVSQAGFFACHCVFFLPQFMAGDVRPKFVVIMSAPALLAATCTMQVYHEKRALSRIKMQDWLRLYILGVEV